MLTLLEPRPLNVDIHCRTSGSSDLETTLRSPLAACTDPRWSLDMLQLFLNQVRRLGCAAVDHEAIARILIVQRNIAFRFEYEAMPSSWVQRSAIVLSTLCRSFVSPAWGSVKLDLTQFVLELVFWSFRFQWPNFESLIATRRFLISATSVEAYPDVPISEAQFLEMPLWTPEDGPHLPAEARRFLFQLFLMFQEVSAPPAKAPSTRKPSRPSRTSTNCTPTEPPSVSARRLLSYASLGSTPVDGLLRALVALLPEPLPNFSCSLGIVEGDSAETSARALWQIIFAQARPASAMTSPPRLEVFGTEFLLSQVLEEVEAVTPSSWLKKSVPFDAQRFPRNRAVVKALCTHGANLCRRGIEDLFPAHGESPALHEATVVPEDMVLAPLVPPVEGEPSRPVSRAP